MDDRWTGRRLDAIVAAVASSAKCEAWIQTHVRGNAEPQSFSTYAAPPASSIARELTCSWPSTKGESSEITPCRHSMPGSHANGPMMSGMSREAGHASVDAARAVPRTVCPFWSRARVNPDESKRLGPIVSDQLPAARLASSASSGYLCSWYRSAGTVELASTNITNAKPSSPQMAPGMATSVSPLEVTIL